MTSRVSSHHVWSQETELKLKLKNPRVKRQLGSTSVGWTSPLQPHEPRPPVYSAQASSKAFTRPHSVRKAATRPNSSASTSYSSQESRLQSSTRPNSSASSRQESRLQSSTRPNSSASSRQESRLQSSSSASLRSVSLGTFSKPLKLAPRPQSSQGFQSRWSTAPRTSPGSITPPQGFDLASYIKQNGSAREIVIGRNGQPTSDNYFDAYLTQCESEVIKKRTETDSEESSTNLFEDDKTNDSAARRHQTVPLCWEDQLALSEPKHLRYVSPTPLVQASAPNGLQFMNSLKVKLMLNNTQCLLDTTCVKFLQDSTTLPGQASSTIAEGKSPNQRLDILLYNLNQHTQQELEKQTFEVYVGRSEAPGFTGESVSVLKDLTARRLPKYVSVINVHLHLDVSQTGRIESRDSPPSSVSVVYGKQRLLLFSAQLQSNPDSPPEGISAPHHSCNGFAEQLHLQLLETQTKEKSYLGTPEVPEKFFRKRTRYCNQEEDEDRTDIALISSYLPELRLTEHEDNSSPLPTALLVATVHNKEPLLTDPTPLYTSVPHSGDKQAPKIIIVPSASEKSSNRHPNLQYTCGEKENEKTLEHYHEDEYGAFSTITNSWIGQYFQ